jgi:hypothetical protein
MSGRLIPEHHLYQSQSRGMDSQSETRKSSDVQINFLIWTINELHLKELTLTYNKNISKLQKMQKTNLTQNQSSVIKTE